MIGPFAKNYRFLSNFYESPIVYDGCPYRTVEHAFQAAKSMDVEIRRQIASAGTPGQAKKMGRNVRIRPGWDEVRIEIMKDLLRKKFAIHELRMKLLGTGNEELVEVNTWGDNFWGTCGTLDSGTNHLGKSLMVVRQEIRETMQLCL